MAVYGSGCDGVIQCICPCKTRARLPVHLNTRLRLMLIMHVVLQVNRGDRLISVHVNDVAWLPLAGTRRSISDLVQIAEWTLERAFFTNTMPERILTAEGTPIAFLSDAEIVVLIGTLSCVCEADVVRTFAVHDQEICRDVLMMGAFLVGGLATKPTLPQECPGARKMFFRVSTITEACEKSKCNVDEQVQSWPRTYMSMIS